MRVSRTWLCFIFVVFQTADALAQWEIVDTSRPDSSRISGIALDVFPLLNGLFSDDTNSDLFTINYLWGRNSQHNEFGLSPRYSLIKTDTEDPVLKSYGLDIRFFFGKTRPVSEKWFVTFGITYEYRFVKDISEREGSNAFDFITTQHAGGLGPQLMFGYRMSDHVWIRSRVAGLLQGSVVKTEIKDGPVEAADQKIKTLNFRFSSPTILELVYVFK